MKIKYFFTILFLSLLLSKGVLAKAVLVEAISMGTTSSTYAGTSTITNQTFTVEDKTKRLANFEFVSAFYSFRGTGTAELRWSSDGNTPNDGSHDAEIFRLNNYRDLINFKAILINSASTGVGTLTVTYSASDKNNN